MSPIDGNTNPVLSCRANNNTVLSESPEGPFPFELPSVAACVTSLVGGRVSWVAFYQNCQQLEQFIGPYPYSFYGNPDYMAAHRLDCVYFVWAFHTGLLPPGPGGGGS